MSDELNPTPEQAANNPEETVTPEAEEQEATVEEALQVEETPKEPDTVGLDKFLDVKKKNKELKRELEDLKSRIDDGASKREVSADIRALADEHNVDPEFLERFAEAVRHKTEEVVEAKLKPLTEREALNRREQLFQQHLDATLKEMPEYKDVINVNILKQLAFNPANAKMTFKQLLEATYGNVVGTERKTIETATPRGGAKSQPLDYDKAQGDTAYFNEIMGDPDLKRQYNEEMLRRA
jgi:hypothetical protein